MLQDRKTEQPLNEDLRLTLTDPTHLHHAQFVIVKRSHIIARINNLANDNEKTRNNTENGK